MSFSEAHREKPWDHGGWGDAAASRGLLAATGRWERPEQALPEGLRSGHSLADPFVDDLWFSKLLENELLVFPVIKLVVICHSGHSIVTYSGP